MTFLRLQSVRVDDRDVELTLEVVRGETVAVTGQNGAGKSTLLDLVAGLLRPDGGSIVIDDADVTAIPPHRRGVALLPQQTLLFPHLTVRENVAFGPRAQGAARREARARADHWLAEVDATHFAPRKATELSGGQAQRVALARALAAEPAILLLDEPLSALDQDAAPAMRTLLARVLAGRTAILVSHDTADVDELAARTIRIEKGQVA
ncbi:MAG: ATP-binding cassette domain-containing protein [Microbacterium sp.]